MDLFGLGPEVTTRTQPHAIPAASVMRKFLRQRARGRAALCWTWTTLGSETPERDWSCTTGFPASPCKGQRVGFLSSHSL